MSNDDSFNDSDEVYSLYSSKKVTDTFKAQLKKIAANSRRADTTLSQVNKAGKKGEENTNCEATASIGKERVVPVAEKHGEPILVIEDESPVPVAFGNRSLEDSIEVIKEITPRRITRQSERLRKKGVQQISPPKNSRKTNSVAVANKQRNRGRNSKSRGKKQQKGKPIEVTLDDPAEQADTEDELNPELTVKVIWKSVNIKKFQIRKFQKLSCIFEQLSAEENIAEDKIMLTFNNVRVSHNDTPDSLNLQVYHFLDGGVLSEVSNLCQTPSSQNSKCGSNFVTIKFQDVSKRIIKLNLDKNEKLKVGMIKCSEQLEIPLHKIKFFFDGELIEPCETPDSLGLENEEVIDIKISS